MKYLIITKEKDFISKSKSAVNHLKKSNGNCVMVYDKEGKFIKYAVRENGKPTDARPCADGRLRKFAVDLIKEYKVGTEFKDAEQFWYNRRNYSIITITENGEKISGKYYELREKYDKRKDHSAECIKMCFRYKFDDISDEYEWFREGEYGVVYKKKGTEKYLYPQY